jgi:predicted chitinase
MSRYSEMTREEAISAYLEHGMTVGQLKMLLENYDDEAKILVAHTASDYWRSPIARNIDGIEETQVKFTDYHTCAQELDGGDDDEDDYRGETIIVLRIDHGGA